MILDGCSLGNAGVGHKHIQSLTNNCANLLSQQCRALWRSQVHPDRISASLFCGVSAHPLERRRDLAGAAGDARVVEQDHLTVASEAIRHRRVPIIHGADVVLVEDERHAAGLAESAIGKADSVSLYELCRCGLVSMNHYGRSLIV